MKLKRTLLLCTALLITQPTFAAPEGAGVAVGGIIAGAVGKAALLVAVTSNDDNPAYNGGSTYYMPDDGDSVSPTPPLIQTEDPNIVDPLESLIAFPGEIGETGDDAPILYVNNDNLQAGNIHTAFLYDPYAPYYYSSGQINQSDGTVTINGHTEQLGTNGQWPQTTSSATTLGDSSATTTSTFVKNVKFTQPITIQQNTTITGTVTFEDDVTISSGKVIYMAPNANVRLKGLIQDNGVFYLNGSKLTLNGNFTFNNGILILNGGGIDGEGGSIRIDPSFVPIIGKNTITPPTSFTDSNNVAFVAPRSSAEFTTSLSVAGGNALVVSYFVNNISAQPNTDLIKAALMSGQFDQVFTLGLNDDGTSTGILQPIDATVTNNQDTFLFNVTQSNTGAKLEIMSGATPDAGSNVDSIIQNLINNNPGFAAYLGYNSIASSYSYRLDNVTNALIGAAGATRGSLSDRIQVNQDEFRFSPVILTKNMSPEKKLETLFEALSQNGAMERSNDEYRVWVSPFSQQDNESGTAASRGWLLGSLVGAEYRSKAGKYTLGLVGGMNFGNQRSKHQTLDGSNIKGMNMGTYGAWGAWEGGRIDGLYIRSLNWLKESRKTNNAIALNDHKATIDMVDLQTSHVFKIPGDLWSVRFNLGHTYSYTNSQGYTEYNVPQQFIGQRRAVSGSIGKSYEVYGGIGLRYNAKGTEWRLRTTGVYEYGKEYKNSGSRIRTSHGKNLNIHTFSTDNNEKAKTHYATLYTSINNSTGWKFIMGYQGAFKKNSVGTNIYAKAEYRF